MRLSQLVLKNFKRFNNLTISDIPATAKLILIVGPNGCGKSSLFDALYHWYRNNAGYGIHGDEKYYKKIPADQFNWHDSVTVNFHGSSRPRKGCLYLRTAYRNDPDFSTNNFQRPSPPTESLPFERVIDNDATVAKNYQRLVYNSLNALYAPENAERTGSQIRDDLIGGIRDSMARVFGDLILNNLADPLQAGAFYFRKGVAESYHYKNLSGGEKAAFDLLLDLHIKRPFYTDAIYGIDEIETHLHTRIQGALLREIVRVIPDDSQLLVTTHSLGVMRAAQLIARAAPDSVAVIDFDGRDFDQPQLITPSKINRVVWEKFLSVALDDLSPQVSPRFVVLCEGSSVGNRRKDFDAHIYNELFNNEFEDIVFISGGNAGQVVAGAPTLRDTLAKVITSANVRPLIDSDDRSAAEITTLKAAGTLVLSMRNLEGYLFSDEVLTALATAEAKPHLVPALLQAKITAIAASIARGNPNDDIKSAAGEVYIQCKNILQLTKCGSDKDAFMRDTLAPLVTPAMACYQLLRQDIIDPLGF